MTKVTRLTLEEGGGLERRRLHLREISDEVDAPLDTVGLDLRAARQRRGDDLAMVSKALKIRKDHLEALEESNIQALPGRTYAIGFVRSYAEYLGLDPTQCVERFKAEIAGRDQAGDEVRFPELVEDSKLPHGTVIFLVLLLIGVVYGGYYLSVSADRLLTQPVSPVPERLASEANGAAGPSAEAPSTGAGTQSPVPATAEPASPSAASGVAAETAAGAPPEADESSAGIDDEPDTAGDAAVEAELPEGRVFGIRNKDPRIVVRVHQLVRVLVQGPDGTVFINRVLRPGDTYRVPNYVGLMLTTSNGGAVELVLDGTSMGFASPKGEMADAISLDPQAVADRYNRARSG